MAPCSKREHNCLGATHVTSISAKESKNRLKAHIGGCDVKSGLALHCGYGHFGCKRGFNGKELSARNIQPVYRISVIGPPTVSPGFTSEAGMAMTVSPSFSLPSLKITPPVWTLEMPYEEATGTAETRANTEARVKNMDAKVNLTMVVKELWESWKEC